MEVAELREQYMELMLNLVKDSDYPSSTILQQVEQSIVTPQDAAAYAEILMEKVQGTFPSHAAGTDWPSDHRAGGSAGAAGRVTASTLDRTCATRYALPAPAAAKQT